MHDLTMNEIHNVDKCFSIKYKLSILSLYLQYLQYFIVVSNLLERSLHFIETEPALTKPDLRSSFSLVFEFPHYSGRAKVGDILGQGTF